MFNTHQIVRSNKVVPNKKEEIEIGKRYISDDYTLLKANVHNRNLDDKNLSKIRENMKINGYDYKFPIIVNTKFEILAGHHRFHCAKELEIEYFYEMTTQSFEEINDREEAHKRWPIEDWIVYRSKIGDNQETYKFIIDLSEKFDITLAHAKDFCTNFNNNKTENDKIRKGVFIIKNKDAVLVFAQKYKWFQDKLEKLGINHTKFRNRWHVTAFQKLINHSKFEMERFKQQVENYSSELHPGNDTETALIKYLHLYNYRRKNTLDLDAFKDKRGKIR